MKKLEKGMGQELGTSITKVPRKAYKKPELTIYGKIAELTACEKGSIADSGHTTPTRRG
jgi:hypothetical protein